jgi:hypothetical protein
MEIRIAHCYGIQAVPDGQNLVVVTKVTPKYYALFSPYSMRDWRMNGTDYDKATGPGDGIWPVNETGLKFELKKFLVSLKTRIPGAKKQSVALLVLKELKGKK